MKNKAINILKFWRVQELFGQADAVLRKGVRR